MATQKFLDNFTGSNGTDLTSHVPNVGTGWTEAEDTAGDNFGRIQTNSARADINGTSASLVMLAVPSPALSSADYRVRCDILAISGAGSANNDDPLILVGRRTSAENQYIVGVYAGTTNLLKLWKIFTAGFTVEQELGSVAYTPTAGHSIELSMIGTAIKVKVNDVDQISVTDSSVTATGSGGFGFGSVFIGTDDVNNGWRIDDFEIIDETSGGGGSSVAVIMKHLREQGIA